MSRTHIGGDAGVAAALDEASRRRRFDVASGGAVGRRRRRAVGRGPRLGRQVDVRFGRRGVRQARRHREKEVVRQVLVQLDAHVAHVAQVMNEKQRTS